jgi:sterol desaturase/sphingolipid hydroxylase (fatty acid hydroxylase superfamily)
MLHLSSYTGIALTVTLRYLVIAGIAWLVYYLLLRRKIAFKKIQQRFPLGKDYRREVGYSVLTVFIFAAVPWLLLSDAFVGYTWYYKDIHEHSTLYFWLAFPLMFILHDAYFYWMHRALHHPKLFKIFHLVHHKSTNPSPWAALAFHPLEAITEAGIFVVFVFVMPIHLTHLVVFFVVMMLYNVYGHLGWELYPKGFSRHWLGKWINTSVNHNQHHQYFVGNYGLYFLLWDRLLGTLRNDYEQRFEEITARKKEEPVFARRKANTTKDKIAM